MNWFRENRFLSKYGLLVGLGTLGALSFLFTAKSDWDKASTRFNNAAAELNRLERLSPYPNGENLRKMKVHAENYSTAFAKLKDELKLRVSPATPMAPNEFQSRLRVAMTSISDKARANKVKLPEKFYLGFDEFASVLPSEAVAPLLGQELLQIEWLLNIVLDARVDGVTTFRRTPLAEEQRAAAPSKPLTGVKAFERNVVEATFLSTPSAARKIINQIAGANQRFCIIRLLHVRNEKPKGPAREVTGETPAGTALNFIVGNERIETTAKIEIVRFTF